MRLILSDTDHRVVCLHPCVGSLAATVAKRVNNQARSASSSLIATVIGKALVGLGIDNSSPLY